MPIVHLHRGQKLIGLARNQAEAEKRRALLPHPEQVTLDPWPFPPAARALQAPAKAPGVRAGVPAPAKASPAAQAKK